MKKIDIIGYTLEDALNEVKKLYPDMEVDVIKIPRDTYRTHDSIFQSDNRVIKVSSDDRSITVYITEV